jgi:cell division protein YceG involved in septum cleavage
MDSGSTQLQASSKLVEQEINDQNKALNVLVSFINLAQKRGAFNLDESAKIWECVKFFTEPPSKG